MQPLIRRRLGSWILLALLLPLGAVLVLGATQAQGQFRPPMRPTIPMPPTPFRPNQGGNNPFPNNPFPNNPFPNNPLRPNLNNPAMPNQGGPLFVRIWKCSRCGRELGRGNVQPQLETCPYCGTRFINGTRPIGNNPNPPVNNGAPPNNPPVNANVNNPQPVIPNNNPPPAAVNNPTPPNTGIANPQMPTPAPAATASTEEGSDSLPYILGGVAGGLLLLALGVGLFLKVNSNPSRDEEEFERRPRRKRRRVYED